MEKYEKVYDRVTIIGVKYMNHVCGPNVSYKLSAFARIFNVPTLLYRCTMRSRSFPMRRMVTPK